MIWDMLFFGQMCTIRAFFTAFPDYLCMWFSFVLTSYTYNYRIAQYGYLYLNSNGVKECQYGILTRVGRIAKNRIFYFFSAIEVNVNPNRLIRIGDDNHVRKYGKFYYKVCF